MAPLSILPGRVRLENQLLIGREQDCRRLENELAGLEAIREVSANHRTGRVLVRFDEKAIDRAGLGDRIEKAMSSIAEGPSDDGSDLPSPVKASSSKEGMSKQIARHMVVDMLVHSILPKPLDLLLPNAVAAFRR